MKLAIFSLRGIPCFRNQSLLLAKTGIHLGYKVDERDITQNVDLKKDRWDRSIVLAPLWPRYIFDSVRISGPWLSRRFTFYGPVDGPFTLNVTFFQVMKNMEIVTTSQWCRDQILKSGVDVKGYCHHGIDPLDFEVDPDKKKAAIERLQNNYPGRKIFFSVINPLHRKGLGHLAKALFYLKEKKPNGWVFILHTGKTEALRLAPELAQAPNLVIEDSYNQLPFRQLALKYACCDCFVFPSLLEGFGLPVLEAAAAEKPIICVDMGPLDEIVNHKSAFMVPYTRILEEAWKGPEAYAQLHDYNPTELAQAMIMFLDNPSLAQDKASAALEASKKFHYLDLYTGLIKGKI